MAELNSCEHLGAQGEHGAIKFGQLLGDTPLLALAFLIVCCEITAHGDAQEAGRSSDHWTYNAVRH
jgi:hypothetical protein